MPLWNAAWPGNYLYGSSGFHTLTADDLPVGNHTGMGRILPAASRIQMSVLTRAAFHIPAAFPAPAPSYIQVAPLPPAVPRTHTAFLAPAASHIPAASPLPAAYRSRTSSDSHSILRPEGRLVHRPPAAFPPAACFQPAMNLQTDILRPSALNPLADILSPCALNPRTHIPYPAAHSFHRLRLHLCLFLFLRMLLRLAGHCFPNKHPAPAEPHFPGFCSQTLLLPRQAGFPYQKPVPHQAVLFR